MVPAVAVNVALLEPASTETVAGTTSPGVLLESITVAPAEPAVWDNVTVHVDVAPELRLVCAHDTELKPSVATKVRAAVWAPLNVAVTTAF